MRRFAELYRKKTDLVSICVISAAFWLIVGFIMFVMRDGIVWGAMTDWSDQHFIIPEYFRSRFYATHDPFPDYAFQLGAGQNIYNLAYYGIANPLFLPAYLMPGVPMSTYVQVLGLGCVWVSAVLGYFFFKRHFSGAMPLVLGLMFLCSGALIFHSHRHIMFIEYLPFELGLLLLFGRKEKPAGLLLISLMTCCVMLTSFYYSVGAFAAAGAYLVFLHLGGKDRGLRSFLRKTWRKIVFAALGCVSAAVLWLPSLAAIVSGREETAVDVPLSRLLVPTVDFSIMLYSPYSAGVTSIVIIAALYTLKNGTAQFRLLSVMTLCFTVLRVFNYLLNGMLYIDGKAFIPFVPLLLLLVGSFVSLKSWRRPDIFAALAVTAVLAAVSLLIINYTRLTFWVLIVETAVTASALLILVLCGKERFAAAVLLVTAFEVCLIENNLEDFVTREKMDAFNSSTLTELVGDTLDGDGDFYRFADSTTDRMNVNRVVRMDYLLTNIYSSVTNAGYRDFRFDTSFSENRIRNNAFQTQPLSVVFSSFMGCRYRVGETPAAMLGEELIASDGGYYIFSSACALPIGYASTHTMNEADFAALPAYEKPEALLENIIVPEGGESWSADDTLPLDIDFSPLAECETVSLGNGVYIVDSDSDFTLTVPLPEIVDGDIILLSFGVDNRIGDISEQKDVIIEVNGVRNKLTDPKWKYNNKNYDFTYVLSSNEPVTELTFSFVPGYYTLTDLDAHILRGEVLTGVMCGKDALKVGSSRTAGDSLFGTLRAEEGGWFTLSIPYDKGFRILVDGQEMPYQRTNTAFIGFPVTPGVHQIEVEYEAPMKKAGMAASTAGAAAALLLAGAVYLSEKRRKTR